MPVPGHEMVRRIDVIGAMVEKLSVGKRVGILWLGHTCGIYPFCLGGDEDLGDRPIFIRYAHDGGFATATIADARFAFPFGEAGDDVSLAPLLCADLIEERRPGDLTWSPWGVTGGDGGVASASAVGSSL
jgi:propanol-preferring alcohol dehydrogenase